MSGDLRSPGRQGRSRALQADERVGLLLPCSLTVRAGADGRTLVDALDPVLMVQLTGSPGLTEVAVEVRSALRAALDAVETR